MPHIISYHITVSSPGLGSVLDSCYGGGAPIMILFKISKRPQFYNFVMGARDFRLSNLTCFQKQLSKWVQKNRTRAKVRVAKLPHPQTILCKIILWRQAKKHPQNCISGSLSTFSESRSSRACSSSYSARSLRGIFLELHIFLFWKSRWDFTHFLEFSVLKL